MDAGNAEQSGTGTGSVASDASDSHGDDGTQSAALKPPHQAPAYAHELSDEEARRDAEAAQRAAQIVGSLLAKPGAPAQFPQQNQQKNREGERGRRGRRRGRGRDRERGLGGAPQQNARLQGHPQPGHAGHQNSQRANQPRNTPVSQQAHVAQQLPVQVAPLADAAPAEVQLPEARIQPQEVSVGEVQAEAVVLETGAPVAELVEQAAAVVGEAVVPAQPQQGQSGRGQRNQSRSWRESTGASSSVSPQQAPSNVRKIVLLNATEPGDIRVAILENGELAEIFMERKSRGQQAGNIYKGRVVNVEPSLQAAFIDLGCERNGFLHASDVIPPDGGYGDVLSRPPRKEKERGQNRDQNQNRDRGDRNNRESGRFQKPQAAAVTTVADAITLASAEGLLPPVLPVQTFNDEALRQPLLLNNPAGGGLSTPGPRDFDTDEEGDETGEPDEVIQPGQAAQTGQAGQPGQQGDRDGKRRRRRRRGGRGRSGRGRLPGAAPMMAPQNSANAQPGQPLTAAHVNTVVVPQNDAAPDAQRTDATTGVGLAHHERAALELVELRAELHENSAPMHTHADASITQELPATSEAPVAEMARAAESQTVSTESAAPEAGEGMLQPDLASQTTVAMSSPLAQSENDSNAGEAASTTTSDSDQPTATTAQESVQVVPLDPDASVDDVDADAATAEPVKNPDEVMSADGSQTEESDAPAASSEPLPVITEINADAPMVDVVEAVSISSIEATSADMTQPAVAGEAAPVQGQPALQQSRSDKSNQRQGGRGGRDGRDRGHERRYLIQEMLREGQEVLIQVAKEGIGQKGPALTTYVSIPGRYLVLMPAVQRLGVSKRIESEEQRRALKDALAQLNPPDDMGVIVRTAGTGRSKDELQRDMEYLTGIWDTMKQKARTVKAPSLIYQEGDVVTRVFRDVITDDVAEIVVDDPAVLERAKEFLRQTAPGTETRLRLYQEKEPLFHRYGVEQQMQRLFNRKVNMKSGGSIVIEQTEALVAIDVNSGRFREKRNQDDTILLTNLEAAREIARQLRLRDIGGLVMIDFIDMEIPEHKRRVERELKAHLARDKARINVLPVSPLGVVEMTRQRVRHSLRKTLFNTCPHCSGSGQVKSAESLGLEMLRELKNQLRDPSLKKMKVLLNSGVAFAILNQFRRDITRMEEQYGVSIEVCGDPAVFLSQMQVSAAKEGGDWVLKKISEVDDYVRNS